jgi:hypothetical protein
MNDAHLMLLPINSNTRLTNEDSKIDTVEHRLYQSIIGSCLYLVTCTRPDFGNPISYLSQCSASPSKSQLTAAKYLRRYIKGTKDLKLSCPRSDVLEITLEG